MAPWLRKGYTLRGSVNQESGWNGSKRYVATLVAPETTPREQQPTQTITEYERGWWEGQRALVMAMVAGEITLEQAASNLKAA